MHSVIDRPSLNRSFPGPPPPTASTQVSPSRKLVPEPRVAPGYRDGIRDDGAMTAAPAFDNSVRIGYARVSTRAQEHQAQLDALAAAHCREIITETASTRGDRPRLRQALSRCRPPTRW